MGELKFQTADRTKHKTGLNCNKILVIFTINWISFSNGFAFGQIAGLIGALQSSDEGIVLSSGQISLIAAFLNLCMIIGFGYITVLGEKYGRKWCFIICSVPAVINWIILYFARNFSEFMMSRFLAGLSVGPLTLLNAVITAEYITRESRALHLTIVTVLTPTFGIASAHILGVLLHWRNLALLGIFLCAVQVFLPYFWVESPHWLAMKGRFEECKQSFRKLHGNSITSEEELQLLVKMEKVKQRAAEETNTNHIWRKLLLAFRKRYFWDLVSMIIIIYIYYTVAGRVVFSNLATVILAEMTGSSDVLLFTLLVDGFILLGTFLSCIFLKKTSIRVLLFSTGLVATGVLVILSICLYFKNSEIYFQWINVALLALYFVIIHAGPYPVIEILVGEIFPLDLKLYCFLITSPVIIGTTFLSLMTLPYLVNIMGYHGIFLMNSIIMLLCLAYLYVRLPETKGKTLQEIEVYFKTKNFDAIEVLNDNEQIKSLI